MQMMPDIDKVGAVAAYQLLYLIFHYFPPLSACPV